MRRQLRATPNCTPSLRQAKSIYRLCYSMYGAAHVRTRPHRHGGLIVGRPSSLPRRHERLSTSKRRHRHQQLVLLDEVHRPPGCQVRAASTRRLSGIMEAALTGLGLHKRVSLKPGYSLLAAGWYMGSADVVQRGMCAPVQVSDHLVGIGRQGAGRPQRQELIHTPRPHLHGRQPVLEVCLALRASQVSQAHLGKYAQQVKGAPMRLALRSPVLRQLPQTDSSRHARLRRPTSACMQRSPPLRQCARRGCSAEQAPRATWTQVGSIVIENSAWKFQLEILGLKVRCQGHHVGKLIHSPFFGTPILYPLPCKAVFQCLLRICYSKRERSAAHKQAPPATVN